MRNSLKLTKKCLSHVLWILLGSMVLALYGCGERAGLAPVSELKWQPLDKSRTKHLVRRGETLYAVAFRYDKDYRELAAYNHLHKPYTLHTGQVLRLNTASAAGFQPKRQARPISPRINLLSRPKHRKHIAFNSSKQHWQWPTNGRLASTFSPKIGHKGINIAGKKGQAIRAAASGTVAYEGNGLPGYGNLIIIKHDGNYLTAYGNNLKNKVTEGQFVKAGQIIADMGIVEHTYWGLHFEIRKQGQPVNPLQYLRKG